MVATVDIDREGVSTSVAHFVESSLGKTAAKFLDICDQADTVFTHFLAGNDRAAGALRLSAVASRASLIKKIREDGDTAEHTVALKRHVQNLSRGQTFLHFVQRHLTRETPKLQKLELKIAFNPAETPTYRISDPEQTDSLITFHGEYTTPFAQSLLPLDRASGYLQNLYKEGELSRAERAELSAWAQEFTLYQYDALPALAISDVVLKREKDTPFLLEYPEAISRWRKLRAVCEFQSALLFCLASSDENPYRDIHVIAARTLQIESDKPKAPPTELYAITIIAGTITEEQRAAVLKALAEQIEKVESWKPKFLAEVNDAVKKCDLTPRGTSEKVYRSEVRSLFHLDCQKDRAYFLVSCFAQLLDRLNQQVHEGETLDFWLLAADRSEIEDHPRTNLKPLSDDSVRALSLMAIQAFENFAAELEKGPRGEKMDKLYDSFAAHLRDRVDACVSQLSKEHFPWFLNGRNALLWDTTRDCFQPCGIVSYEGSSWGQLLNELYRGEANVDLPSMLLGFVGGAPRDVGVLRHERDRHKSRLQRILTLKKTGWVLTQYDQRRRLLMGLLGRRLGLADEKNADILDENRRNVSAFVAICITVADHPKIGGTLVLLKPQEEGDSGPHPRPFSQLGSHWDIDTSLEDRIALIGHDGATLVRLGQPKWDYRFLLSSDGVPTAIRQGLEFFANNPKHPLSSVGSRRWSAALASFKREVRGIVVVSQDGDMQCWFPADEWTGSTEKEGQEEFEYCKDIVRKSAVYRFRQNEDPDKLIIQAEGTRSVSTWLPLKESNPDIAEDFIE